MILTDQNQYWKAPVSTLILTVVYLFRRFFEILALTYVPGPYGPGPLIIWKNFLRQICSRTISKKHTAPRACFLHAPGTVCFSNMVLVHIWRRKFFQIISGLVA